MAQQRLAATKLLASHWRTRGEAVKPAPCSRTAYWQGPSWQRALESLRLASASDSGCGSGDCEPSALPRQRYQRAIAACARGAQWARAAWLVQHLRSLGLQPAPATCTALLSACARGVRWEAAVAHFDEMQTASVRHDVYAHTALLTACANMGHWQMAVRCLWRMRDMGIVPNLVSYSAAVSACSKDAKVSIALDLLDSMDVAHIQPNMRTFGAVLDACQATSRWQMALLFLHRTEASRVRPDGVAWLSALQANEISHRRDEVKRLFPRLRSWLHAWQQEPAHRRHVTAAEGLAVAWALWRWATPDVSDVQLARSLAGVHEQLQQLRSNLATLAVRQPRTLQQVNDFGPWTRDSLLLLEAGDAAGKHGERFQVWRVLSSEAWANTMEVPAKATAPPPARGLLVLLAYSLRFAGQQSELSAADFAASKGAVARFAMDCWLESQTTAQDRA